MRMLAILLLGFVLVLPVLGCGSGGGDGDFHGLEECALCTSTSQCDTGLTCLAFTDGRSRCSRLGQTCP